MKAQLRILPINLQRWGGLKIRYAQDGGNFYSRVAHSACPAAFLKYGSLAKGRLYDTYNVLSHSAVARGVVAAAGCNIGIFAAHRLSRPALETDARLIAAASLTSFFLELVRSKNQALAIACAVGSLLTALLLSVFSLSSIGAATAFSISGAAVAAATTLLIQHCTKKLDCTHAAHGNIPDRDTTQNDTIAYQDDKLKDKQKNKIAQNESPISSALLRLPVESPKSLPATILQPCGFDIWLAKLTKRLDTLEGPYANSYRSKGLIKITTAKGQQTEEDRKGTRDWLERFDRLLDTLRPLETCLEHRRQAEKMLDTSFEKIWENQQVKQRVRERLLLQLRGKQPAAIVCITGPSGSGKNTIASASRCAFGAHLELNLLDTPAETLTGHKAVYTKSAPSAVTSLLMESPDRYCLLHLDELDQCERDKQRTLLSLLENTNDFVDQYFGLPINKNRLFIICTMKADASTLPHMLTDLWSRIGGHVVETSPMTRSGKRWVIERRLRSCFANLQVENETRVDFHSMAREISASSDRPETARSLEAQITQITAVASFLSNSRQLPPIMNAEFISRCFDQTWNIRPTSMQPLTTDIEAYAAKEKFLSLHPAGREADAEQHDIILCAYRDCSENVSANWTICTKNQILRFTLNNQKLRMYISLENDKEVVEKTRVYLTPEILNRATFEPNEFMRAPALETEHLVQHHSKTCFYEPSKPVEFCGEDIGDWSTPCNDEWALIHLPLSLAQFFPPEIESAKTETVKSNQLRNKIVETRSAGDIAEEVLEKLLFD